MLFAALASFTGKADAHQNGCHRWHSCPPDTPGAYVCGDLGYTTYCPPTQPTQPRTHNQNQTSASNPPQISNRGIAQNALSQVVSVSDGDTISVRQGNEQFSVRLACVDSPERAQKPWSEYSANRLKQLLPSGQTVQIRVVDIDRYGRTVAEVYRGNQSVNLQMVQEGQAVVYPQYLNGCAATKDQYLQAEAVAKQQRLGLWNQNNPIMPWNFRRGKRSS